MMTRSLAVLFALVLAISPGAARGVTFDHDGDGDVDWGDLQDFTTCMLGPDFEASPPCLDWHDADADLDVDLFDFSALQRAYTGAQFPFTPTQLAGNVLDEYPYFEYVKAFNENAPITVAIDTSRFPGLAGLTGDIYIVEAKTVGGWELDPTLVDETADGPQTETFGGATIQENTFVVAGPYELDSAVYQTETGDYTGLGHGYDVVLDMNQNGVFDAGDYIDGYGREAGLYVVHDTTTAGPLAVTYVGPYSVSQIPGVPATAANQVLYYPTDIATMSPRPLVVIGHGAGHNYLWYGHIGNHLASYGYIVISHQNNFSGYAMAAHTRALIELQDSIADGALDGKVDSHRITWIGHSMGGHGVSLAYALVYDGAYIPEYYTIDDIALLSPMLPVVLTGDEPHHANFHLWSAAGDGDVSGAAGLEIGQTFRVHDRATGFRSSTVVQGTGHAWFHDGPEEPSWFEGPCSIGRANTHLIELGMFLPLVKYYNEGNIPGLDFLTRQYERFHPIGVDTSEPCIVVTTEYRNGADHGNYYIDDYQTEPSTYISSSGGAVTYTVSNVLEGLLDDNNSDFAWSSTDPFNGATQAAASDTSRGVVFDWNGINKYYEWEIVPGWRDLTSHKFLSFRGAQGTRHPYTLAVMGDVTFTVTLRDGAGVQSSINIGAYGGGLEQPYAREGGWYNEMEVIRIRLTDFLTNGSGLDLSDVAAVRFNFGPSWGSNEGRIVVDELMLTNDVRPRFLPMQLELLTVLPEYVPAGVAITVDARLDPADDTLVPGSALVHYRYEAGPFATMPLEPVSGELWRATLPAPACGDEPEFYVTAEGEGTGGVAAPPSGAVKAFVGAYVSVFVDDFETDQGWTVVGDPSLTSGVWERGLPAGGGSMGDPLEDYDGSGSCYLTDLAWAHDVDWGPTWLTSPTLDMSGLTDPVLRYARWMSCDDFGTTAEDYLYVELSNDGGASWVTVETVVDDYWEPTFAGWVPVELRISDYVALTEQVQLRFWTDDTPNNSKTEAGVDAVEIFDVQCP